MQRLTRAFGLLLMCALLAVSAMVLLAQEEMPGAVACRLPLSASVQIGLSTGTVYEGELVFLANTRGDLVGRFERNDGTTVNVFGHVEGRAIALGFEFEAQTEEITGSYMFATGVTRNPVFGSTDCGRVLGGTFTGPREGDLGGWEGYCVAAEQVDADSDPAVAELLEVIANDPSFAPAFGLVETQYVCSSG